MAFDIQRVTKEQARLRLGLSGPSGSGKTWTALSIAKFMGGKTCLFDTEYGSASKYASDFEFDGALIEKDYHPERYIEALKEAEAAGYDNVILDSLSHGWNGPGGVLELVSAATKRKGGNSYAAWDDVTPIYRRLIHSIMGSRCHVIVTLRAKQDYLQEKDANGRTQIRKVGMAPEIREGFSYEMDIEGLLDIDHNLIIGKTRCAALDGKVFNKPGKEFADIVKHWLNDGAPATEKAVDPENLPESRASVQPKPAPPEWWAHYGTLCKFNKVSQEDVAEHLGVEKATGAAIEAYIKSQPHLLPEGAIAHLVGEIAAKRLEVPA